MAQEAIFLCVVLCPAESAAPSLAKDAPQAHAQASPVGNSEANADDASPADSQVADPGVDSDFAREVEQASRRGGTLPGMRCDVPALTDAEGNGLLSEYRAFRSREGASLILAFSIALKPGAMEKTANAALAPCVSGDLRSRFSITGPVRFAIAPAGRDGR